MSAMSSSKKQRLAPDVQYVLLSPFDEPFHHVRVDRKIIDEYDCHTAKMLRTDAPHFYAEGMPAWNVNVTRSMLIAFIKSLVTHELVIPKDVTYDEAVRMLDYEGIGCPGNEIEEPKLRESLLHPKSVGFGVYKAEEAAAERMARVATMVANAIVEWPRPRIMITETLDGKDTDASGSASRFWVRFAPRPAMEKYGGDELYALSRKRPAWLQTTLGAIGFVHCDLVRRGEIEASARDEPSFTKLADYIRNRDMTRYYISVRRDMPRHHRDLNRDVIKHADRWAAWVMTTVADHGDVRDMVQLAPNDDRRTRRGAGSAVTMYARAAIALAEREMTQTPNCYRLFSGDCCDEEKKVSTPEREVLKKALKARGAKIVRWRDNPTEGEKPISPLAFPPSFYSHLIGDGPCALIEMELGAV
jgi:hypothetical protein